LEKNTYKKTLIKNHFFYKKKEEEAKRTGLASQANTPDPSNKSLRT
jgi:hypothetical protein